MLERAADVVDVVVGERGEGVVPADIAGVVFAAVEVCAVEDGGGEEVSGLPLRHVGGDGRCDGDDFCGCAGRRQEDGGEEEEENGVTRCICQKYGMSRRVDLSESIANIFYRGRRERTGRVHGPV